MLEIELHRRRFLQGMAVASVSSGSAAAIKGRVAASEVLALHDPQCDSGVRFAAAARAAGARVVAIEGDRIRLMSTQLDLATLPASIIGLGRYADYLLLADAAAEKGYRLVGDGSHDGCGSHRCTGSLRGAGLLLDRSGEAWPEALVEVMLAGTVTRPRAAARLKDRGLLSWVMIPRA